MIGLLPPVAMSDWDAVVAFNSSAVAPRRTRTTSSVTLKELLHDHQGWHQWFRPHPAAWMISLRYRFSDIEIVGINDLLEPDYRPTC